MKSLLLGLLLMNYFSLNVLRAAVSQLGKQIAYDVETADATAAQSRVTQLINEVRRVVGVNPVSGSAGSPGATVTPSSPAVSDTSGQAPAQGAGSGGNNDGSVPPVTPSTDVRLSSSI